MGAFSDEEFKKFNLFYPGYKINATMKADHSREENKSHWGPTSLLHSVTHPTGIVFQIIGAMLLCFIGFGEKLMIYLGEGCLI